MPHIFCLLSLCNPIIVDHRPKVCVSPYSSGCPFPVRTGLEGPGLTVAQKLLYCIATVGGQYVWARLQSFSAFRRWGDSEQVLFRS